MKSQHIVYMVAQVLSRHIDGTLKEWYDGVQLASYQEAKTEQRKMRKEFKNTEFVVIKRTIEEL